MTHMTYPHPSTSGPRKRAVTLHVGTFADGQRTLPLTATYSAEIGSFADTDRT